MFIYVNSTIITDLFIDMLARVGATALFVLVGNAGFEIASRVSAAPSPLRR